MSSFSRFLLVSAAPERFGGRRRFLAALVLLAAVPSLLAAQTQPPKPPPRPAEIAVVPVIVHLSVLDTAQGVAIQVANQGGTDAQLRFYLGDFEQKESGDYTYLPFGAGQHSCGARLSAFPDGAVVGAGKQDAVQLRLAPGGGVCWGMLFVESAPQGRGTVRIIQRVAVKIMNAPPQSTVTGEVTGVTATRARADTVRVRTVFQNTGQAPLDLRGRVEIRDYAGKVLAQTEFGPFGSLPGRNRVIEVAVVTRLQPGNYVAVPIVDFGGDYLAGGQATFKIP